MSAIPSRIAPERIHPALWRASQRSWAAGACLDTGYPALSAALPGNGWPLGVMIELLLPRHGIGELPLLCPALRTLSPQGIALVHPPHPPNAPAWVQQGFDASHLLWLHPPHPADAAWAAESLLRSGTFGAILLWHTALPPASLRRLHLAAQYGQALFALLRPLTATATPSPAPLRLTLQPARQGLHVTPFKRRGAINASPILIPLPGYPAPVPDAKAPHANLDRPAAPAPEPERTLS